MTSKYHQPSLLFYVWFTVFPWFFPHLVLNRNGFGPTIQFLGGIYLVSSNVSNMNCVEHTHSMGISSQRSLYLWPHTCIYTRTSYSGTYWKGDHRRHHDKLLFFVTPTNCTNIIELWHTLFLSHTLPRLNFYSVFWYAVHGMWGYVRIWERWDNRSRSFNHFIRTW